MYYRQFIKDQRQRRIRKTFKNIVEGFLVIFCFIIIPGIAGMIESRYNYNGIITEVNGAEVLIEDVTGNQWEIEQAGYKVGDKVRVTFDTMHTDNTRQDDIIIKVIKIKDNNNIKRYE